MPRSKCIEHGATPRLNRTACLSILHPTLCYGLVKVVILGTGWGAHALLKGIDAAKFDVTTVSPRNFFLFTPMLAASAGERLTEILSEMKRATSIDVMMLPVLKRCFETTALAFNLDAHRSQGKLVCGFMQT